MNPTTALPYELHTTGSGIFITFEIGDQIALPLMTLARATFRATKKCDEIVLEFQKAEIVLEGRALALMLDHLLAGRVKRISRACMDSCEVSDIRISDIA